MPGRPPARGPGRRLSGSLTGSPGAVGASTTVRPSRPARSIAASIASRRSGQCEAEAQPLSTTSRSGPEPAKLCRSGLSTGRASAKMISAASSMRSNVSHHGLCAGVSSVVLRSFRSRVGGNTTTCGLGGVSRNSHQIAGSAASAASTHGCRKPIVPSVIMAAAPLLSRCPRRAAARDSDSRAQARRGDYGGRAPLPRPDGRCDARGRTSRAAAWSRRDRCGALEPLLVALAQCLDAAGDHPVPAFDRGELGAAIVRKRLLGGIEHLDEMAAHALAPRWLRGRSAVSSTGSSKSLNRRHSEKRLSLAAGGKLASAVSRIRTSATRRAALRPLKGRPPNTPTRSPPRARSSVKRKR